MACRFCFAFRLENFLSRMQLAALLSAAASAKLLQWWFLEHHGA
jgi:hypothetical protein